MKSARRLACALSVFFLSLPAALAAATGHPIRLTAAAQGQVIDAPGTDVRAEVVTFGASLAPSLLRVSLEETVVVAGWPVSPGERADVRLTRFDVYAPGAKIWKVEGDRKTEVPRSRMAFFEGMAEDAPDVRVFVAVEPDTGRFQGLTISPRGRYEIRPTGEREHLVTVPEYFLPQNGQAQPVTWRCGQSDAKLTPEIPLEPSDEAVTGRVLSSLHTVTVTVDTDNELLSLKFSDNATNATSYVAALIAAMTVTYERDLNIRLLQGTTFLRVSSTPDPFSQLPDSNGLVTNAQLSEFANYWVANNGGVTRGLAMLLSGKSPNQFLSAGLGYVNTLCSSSFGYSFSQVFKYNGSTGASDAFVVGHELGHNFGSQHTHNPAGYNPPIDTCATTTNTNLFNCLTQCTAQQCSVLAGDGALACNACPAATTINGVNTQGTLMSYCNNLSPFGSCNTQQVFHPRTIDLITGLVTPKIGICVFPAVTVSQTSPNHGLASGGTPVTITGSGFQNGATVTFGGTASPSVTFNNSTQLTATTPAHAAGQVNVVVTNPDTSSGTGTNAFTFDSIPSISSLSPNSGTTAGGTSVAINGANFQNGATVTFGGTAVAVTFNNSTKLTVTAPAHATGAVGVTVTNPDTGFGTKTNAYFYTPPPAGTDYFSLTPCRLLDTRLADGPLGGPVLGANSERVFTIINTCGIPAGAAAVSVNVTVVAPAGSGFLSLDPGNAFFLGTATLSFQTGEILSNNATLLLSTDGSGAFRILNAASGNTHVVVDVTGYYTP
ncbi:MAG TPA: IPT/TIG domain-containing protein [Thermoanaerobaculia bacterium]|nr:IPT/TIG domain-containing protein [Thermoanaerobaculia bacterium]